MNYQILINKKHKIPEDFFEDLELVKTKDIEGLDVFCEKETFKHYEELRKYLLETTGIEIGIDSAFRTGTRQKEIYYEFLEKEGKEYADSIVAPVGCSEHETGLAMDITIHIEDKGFLVENSDIMDYVDVYEKFIHPVISKFGFILRYPKGKEEITGYAYEPWHIRYIGEEFIQKYSDVINKLSLEEIFVE